MSGRWRRDDGQGAEGQKGGEVLGGWTPVAFMRTCVCVGDRQESPQGTLHVAIDKDSLGKFLSLVLRHSSVIQPCQVCHETKKEVNE